MKHTYLLAARLPRLAGRAGGLLLALGLATAAQAQAPSFGPMSTYAPGGAQPYFVATADLNHDNVLDIVSSNLAGDNVGVLLGQAAGGFAPVVTYSLAQSFNPEEVVLVDTNSDGQLDMVVGGRGATTVAVLRGTATGTFGTAQLYATGSSAGTFALKMADVTQDGILDIVGTNLSSRVYVLPGTAAGGFGPAVGYTVGSSLRGLALADFNGDARPDIVVNDAVTNAVFVLLSQGSGFASPVSYSTSFGGYFVEVGDLNRDGQPDIIAGQGPSGGGVTVLTGKPGGTFNASANYLVGGSGDFISGVTVGDVNGDGLPDVVAANATQGRVAVLPGTGTGALGTAVVYSAGSFTYDVTLADLNRDGKPDIVVANANSPTVGVLLNSVVLVAPVLTTISPVSGPVGTSVTLTGTGLSSATAVTFNGTPAPGFVVNANGTITVAVPAGATTGPVVVTTPAGTSNALTFTVSYPDLVVTTTTPIAAGTYNSITVNSPGVGTLAGNVTVLSTVTVNDGATLNDGCFIISGAGTFTLAAGGTLGICDAQGISSIAATGTVQVTGTRTFSTDASYVYNGTVIQFSGNSIPSQVRNLTSTNPIRLTMSKGVYVSQVITVAGAGDIALPALRLLSSASGTALVVNSGTGVISSDMIIQRYTAPGPNPGLGYRHYSSPVQAMPVGYLATPGYTPVISTAYNTSATPGLVTPFPNMFGYDQSRLTLANNLPAFDKGFVSPTDLAETMTIGRGYAVNISASELVNFYGIPNTGNQTLTLARNSGATAADAGWALVGNPYPAPLDYSLVQPADRSGLDAAIYVVQSTGQYTGGYRAYVNGQSTSATNSPVLAMAQAFFVRVSAGRTSGTLTFRNSQRVTTYASQAAFQRSPAADARPAVRLELAGASLADAFVAYAEAGATNAFDGEYDATKLANSTGLNLSSVAAGERLAIDGRPAFTAATALPLAVGVPAAGTYTLTATALNNLPVGLDAYLRDAATGQTVRLSQGTRYSFSVTAPQAQALLLGRFTLQFSPQQALATAPGLTATDVAVYPNPAHESFTVVVPAVADAASVRAELHNALGQRVYQRTAALPASGTRLTVPTSELATGVYILRLQAGDAVITKRVVVQ